MRNSALGPSWLLSLLSLFTWGPERVQGLRRLALEASSVRPTAHAANNTDSSYLSHDADSRHLDYTLPTSPEEHRVTSLPLFDENDDLVHYAGHLPASANDDKYFFYWLFHPPQNTQVDDEATIPLVIWLNGGPGCSSMDGLFLEHGPIRFDENNKLVRNLYSWHTAPAYVVYVDQPVGTGLSFTKSKTYPSNDDKVNADFYHWFVQLLTLYEDDFLRPSDDNSFVTKRPIYFTGESHAGHYIPSMMAYILRQNQQGSSNIQITLTGAAIGNGWVDPFHQYAAAQAAFGHGLLGIAQVAALQEKEQTCQQNLNNKQYKSNVCFDLLDEVVAESQGGRQAKYKVSQYDVRKWESRHGSRTFPPGHKVVESYLGGWPGQPEIATDQVLEAIHASAASTYGQRYRECTDPPYNALAHQDGLGVVNEVVTLLENEVSLLFFNGVMDLICNHVGNEVTLEKLPWKYQKEWNLAPRYSWSASLGSTPSGYMKEYGSLKYLKVLDSGHMVPLDVPDVALAVVKTFFYGGTFDTNKQELDRALPSDGKECEACPKCDAPSDGNTPGGASAEDSPVLKYVIAHSWLGAFLAVSFFLVVLLWVRRRQEPQATGRHRRMGSGASYQLELKEQDRYRDEPDVENGFDEEEQENGLYPASGQSQASSSTHSVI